MSVDYPVYVHRGDDRHAHGITVPDFPGCFSAADAWDEIPAKVQEAVEVYCEGEDMQLPSPSSIEELQAQPGYQGGEWLLVPLNVAASRSVANPPLVLDGDAHRHL